MSIFPFNFDKPKNFTLMFFINCFILLAIISGNLVIHYKKYSFMVDVLKEKINRFSKEPKKVGYIDKINIITHENTMTLEYYTLLKTIGDPQKIQEQLTSLNGHYQMKIQIVNGFIVLIIQNVVDKEDIKKITDILSANF